MITILYPYRNRELERVKRSLDSLAEQTNEDFVVQFVDYGSSPDMATKIQELVDTYWFARYHYSFSELQPWSRAKALNIGIKATTTDYVFAADVDMIFRSDFVAQLQELKNSSKAYYFKVGFLSKAETAIMKKFEKYSIAFSSGIGAQGLSLFPLEAIKKVNGFDEFFHFWGAEDEDIHNRMRNAGFETIFHDTEVLMLHQWHSSYRASEVKSLNEDLQLTNVSRLNQQHLLENKNKKWRLINTDQYGKGVSKMEFEALQKHTKCSVIINKNESVDYFLFNVLPNFKDGILNVEFREDDFQNSTKYWVKKVLGKTVPKYYSLKEINDQLLIHIIAFYAKYPYTFSVNLDLRSIVFKIKK